MPVPAAPSHYEGTGPNAFNAAMPGGKAVAVLHATHNGSRNFVIKQLDATTGHGEELYVNTIGSYTGSHLVILDSASAAPVFEVDADGYWTLDLVDILTVPQWDGVSPMGAVGDTVFTVPGGLDKLTFAQIEHTGERNFVVRTYDSSGRDLHVNDIGPYSGRHAIPAGVIIVDVQGDGAWGITPTA
jgi:hypothetical protein